MFKTAKIRNIFFSLLGLLVICVIAIAYMYTQINTLKKSPEEVAKNEVADIIERVGKLTVLPTDEEATVATVTNLDRLKDQAFFANAQIGDKVLIYQANRKAILYNPTSNKIIEISSVNLGAGTQTNVATSTQ